jgi:hypothetical protein
MTKTQKVLNALLSGDHMTHLKALAYGTYRLADVVFRLRGKGFVIRAEDHVDADGTRYTSYYIPAEYLDFSRRLAADLYREAA